MSFCHTHIVLFLNHLHKNIRLTFLLIFRCRLWHIPITFSSLTPIAKKLHIMQPHLQTFPLSHRLLFQPICIPSLDRIWTIATGRVKHHRRSQKPCVPYLFSHLLRWHPHMPHLQHHARQHQQQRRHIRWSHCNRCLASSTTTPLPSPFTASRRNMPRRQHTSQWPTVSSEKLRPPRRHHQSTRNDPRVDLPTINTSHISLSFQFHFFHTDAEHSSHSCKLVRINTHCSWSFPVRM